MEFGVDSVSNSIGGGVGVFRTNFDSLKLETEGCTTRIGCSWSGGMTIAGIAAPSVFAAPFGGGASALSVVPKDSSTLPRFLYTYTSEGTATAIQNSGRIGLPNRNVFLTNNGSLRPVQAQIELALPSNNSATAIFRVDTTLLNARPFLTRRVTGNVFNRAGGGMEYIFNSPIPQNAFRRIQ